MVFSQLVFPSEEELKESAQLCSLGLQPKLFYYYFKVPANTSNASPSCCDPI